MPRTEINIDHVSHTMNPEGTFIKLTGGAATASYLVGTLSS